MEFNKEKTQVLILSHFLINPFENAATSTTIRNFLLLKVKRIVQIEQPFPDSRDKFSYLLVYENGKLKKTWKISVLKRPSWLAYFVHILLAYYFVLESFTKSFDYCIACENLSFFAVFPFRKLGLIKRVVYYSVDYVEDRFQNQLLNKIYHFLDRIACRNSDVNWVVALKQTTGRRKNGIRLSECAPFKVVPISFRSSDIKVLPIEKIDYYRLVFCGGLRESAGPQLIISTLPLLLKKFPKIRLVIVGGGNYQKYLKNLAIKLKVIKYIKFFSNVSKHTEVVSILTRGSIGLAPYAHVPGSISYRSDPGKIRLYLACGLPVITTGIATSGPTLVKKGAGLVVDYRERDLFKAIDYLLSNRKRYLSYKNNAISLSKKYDADNILGKAFDELPF